MPAVGDVALIRFPHTDLTEGKLRPVLLLAQPPGRHGDWLVCMVSSRLQQQVADFDEAIGHEDSDFVTSGLRVASVIRLGRLAVVQEPLLVGALGTISEERARRLVLRLARWLADATPQRPA